MLLEEGRGDWREEESLVTRLISGAKKALSSKLAVTYLSNVLSWSSMQVLAFTFAGRCCYSNDYTAVYGALNKSFSVI